MKHPPTFDAKSRERKLPNHGDRFAVFGAFQTLLLIIM